MIGRRRSHPCGDRCRPFSLWSGRSFGDYRGGHQAMAFAPAGRESSYFFFFFAEDFLADFFFAGFFAIRDGSLLVSVRYSISGTARDASSRVPRSIRCPREKISRVVSLTTSERASLDPGRAALTSLLVLLNAPIESGRGMFRQVEFRELRQSFFRARDASENSGALRAAEEDGTVDWYDRDDRSRTKCSVLSTRYLLLK